MTPRSLRDEDNDRDEPAWPSPRRRSTLMCLRLSLPWRSASKTTRGSTRQSPKYINHGQHASGHGGITNIAANYQYGPSNPLEELEKHCSHSAVFDSGRRFQADPPRCAESTRLRIIQIAEDWVNDDGDNPESASLFWLHGGAGVGKSAVAQSLSEKFKQRDQLVASFFFLKSDPTRNNGEPLIPTLVFQLIDSFAGIVPFVEDSIRENRALFTKTHEVQIQKLLIEPLLALKSQRDSVARPRLIVIDGLDECQNPDTQCELLRVIALAIPRIPYPLRLFVTSRPEAHITHAFNHEPDLQAIPVHRYNLSEDPDADMDIRTVLEKEFVEIRRVHRLRRYLSNWPDQKTITSLVERSSGHFIYASTVIKYIRSPKHRPDDRLEVILRLRPPQDGDRPYAQLDALYALIFEGVERRSELEKICLVLGILHFQSKRVGIFWRLGPDRKTIEKLLGMKAGDLLLLLDPILSLIAFHDDKVRILHKSLYDYLLDFTRGGHLPFDLARVHEVAATYVLKQKILKRLCDMDDFREFAYHSQYAYLNDTTLKKYLSSLVPFPESVMVKPTRLAEWPHDKIESMRKSMWYFFRTLSREDLDSTGQVHDRYLSEWMSYFQSDLSMGGSDSLSAVDSLKLKVDALLEEWNPQNFNLDVGMDQVQRVSLIQEEDKIFSFFEDSFKGDHRSSIVLCDRFIHSYCLRMQRNMRLSVILRTYSRHSNACYQVERVGNSDKVVQEMLDYVTRNEQYLFSDLYQKYGVLEPDVVGMSHSIQRRKAILAEL